MQALKHWLKLLTPLAVLAGGVAYVAYRTRRVPIPHRRWRRFYQPDAVALDATTCHTLQGIYTLEEGADFFGQSAVLKWSYTVEESGPVYHLSLFCEKDGTYLVCEGRRQGTGILLSGYWRKAAANGTGLVWLQLQNNATLPGNGHKQQTFTGWYGHGRKKPRRTVSFHLQQSLPAVPPLDIIAHRGGARNVDFMAVSENSIDMVKRAARLGANGIEIDVRLTKDGVPVIFHDSFFSIHTVQGKIFGGLLHRHTLAEVKRLKLRKGGRIPTLDEMLWTVLYQTPLEVVWLDIKKECDLQVIHRLQQTYHQKAAALGRTLRIYIGIPDEYVLSCFKQLPGFPQIPSLTELDCNVALDIHADVWAPQYTGGFQADDVACIHAAGKKAYVWSLDSRLMIDLYMNEGSFDGLVTNVAPVVAHWQYMRAIKAEKNVSVNPVQATHHKPL